MDEEDFLALIAVLEQQFRDIGAAELADARHYTLRDPATGDARLYDGHRRLKLMLEALGRRIAIEDRATYNTALARINGAVREGGLRDVIVEAADGRIVNLSEAPHLSDVREELRRLIAQILEAPPPATERA
jgi:hypothetical protein